LSDKLRVSNILSKAENIADVLLRHLYETGGCNHSVNKIVEEAFGPSLEAKDQYQDRSIILTKEEVTT